MPSEAAITGARRRRFRRRHGSFVAEVRLGTLVPGSLAPAMLAIVERGVRRRPRLAHELGAEIELRFLEQYPPVRIVFGDQLVVVEDGPCEAPDVRIQGTLPDLISLLIAPLLGGLPLPVSARGRAALGMVAARRVRFEGPLGTVRRFLALVRV